MRCINRFAACAVALAMGCAATGANAQSIVFANFADNGFFAQFNSGLSLNTKYGDSGWIGFIDNGNPRFTLSKIDLSMVAYQGTGAGEIDVTFTLNDGDASGLGFGSGAVLYSVDLNGIQVPDTTGVFQNLEPFLLEIPLPDVVTRGGFNNIGWSLKINRFAFDGSVGFQCATGSAAGQPVGFYTNNASFFNGTSWSLFSFGPDPVFGVANFVTTIYGDRFCPADLTNDLFVDDSDFVIFAAAYEQFNCASPVGCIGDFNGDFFVDDADFVIFAEAYEEFVCN